MSDRAETEADLGTLPPEEMRCFPGVSFWPLSRRPLSGSRPRGLEFFVPVLLLRRRTRFKLARSAGSRTKHQVEKNSQAQTSLIFQSGKFSQSCAGPTSPRRWAKTVSLFHFFLSTVFWICCCETIPLHSFKHHTVCLRESTHGQKMWKEAN